MTELEYLDRVYAADGGQYFDIMSAQAYGLGQSPDKHFYLFVRRPDNWSWTRPIDTSIDVSRLALLHEVMLLHGDSQKAVWVSEFGYTSAPDTIPADRRFTWGRPVTEDQKGSYLVGQLLRARREWPWVGVMNVWFLHWGGSPPDPADPTAYFAISDMNFHPLPAYQQLQDYLAQPTTAGVGAHQWSYPAVTPVSGGVWNVRFEGTTLALAGSGHWQVRIDGGAALSIAGVGQDQPVRVGGELGSGVHIAQVQSSTAAPTVFIVGHTPPLPWIWTAAPALLIVLLTLTGGVLGQALAQRVALKD